MKRLIAATVLGVGVLSAGMSACMADTLPKHQIRYDYTVRRGDTLWDIAAKNAPEAKDIREYIYELKKINGLEGEGIKPGQVLTLYHY